QQLVVSLEDVRHGDLEHVGGKNASLGELLGSLTSLGIRVPTGFATTAAAFRLLLAAGGLGERIDAVLAGLDVEDVPALATSGARNRGWTRTTPRPAELDAAILQASRRMERRRGSAQEARSWPTAEDHAEAPFAGQQETLLNVSGESALLAATREVYD